MIRGPFRSVSGHLETRPTRGPAHGPRCGGGTIDWWCARNFDDSSQDIALTLF